MNSLNQNICFILFCCCVMYAQFTHPFLLICVHTFFLSFLFIASLFILLSACSMNPKTVQELAFMVTSSSYDSKNPAGAAVTTTTCNYIGLQAYCGASCGKVTDTLPKDDLTRNCYDSIIKVSGTVDGTKVTNVDTYINTFSYKALSALYFCEDPTKMNPLSVVQCAIYTTCQSAGNVTLAFAILGCIGALLAMAVFAWRMNGDGMCAKITSVIFSTATFICCTTAFGAFQKCASLSYDYTKASLITSAATNSYTNPVVGVAPGVGGIMAVTSFCFFIYVMLMSLFIPGANPAASGAGLDSKA